MNALVVFAAVLACASAQYYPGFYSGYGAGYLGGYGYGYNGGYLRSGYAGYAGAAAYPYAAAYARPYAAYAAAPAPVSYASSYHAQDEFGQASFGHRQLDQGHSAVRDAAGNVHGEYSYINPEGQTIVAKYTAGAGGFQVASNALPVAPVDTGVAPVAPVYTGVAPAPVQVTPEVAAATAEHLAAHAKALEESKDRKKRAVVYSGLSPFLGLRAGYGLHGYGYAAGLPYAAGLRTYAAGFPATYAAGFPATYAAGFPAAYAAAVPAQAGYEAELTTVEMNPGHASAYRVDPVRA